MVPGTVFGAISGRFCGCNTQSRLLDKTAGKPLIQVYPEKIIPGYVCQLYMYADGLLQHITALGASPSRAVGMDADATS